MAFTAGTFPTYTAFNELPRGMLGVAVGDATNYTNSTASYTQLTCTTGSSPTLTLTLQTDRKYRARFHGRFSNASNTYLLVGFHEGGVLRDAAQFKLYATATTHRAEWVFTPNAGGSVIYAIFVALNGSGTIAASANSQFPMVFSIEDLGLA